MDRHGRIKKYHNPHHYFNEESLKTVSRRELAGNLDGCGGLADSNLGSKNNPTISTATDVLNDILSPLGIDFLGAIRGCKRKRDEAQVSAENKDQGTEIRLLSRRPALVTTSELVDSWPSRPKVYACEDTSDEAKERKRRAKQVAIEFDVIMKQSTVRYPGLKEVTIPTHKSKTTWAPTVLAVVESPRAKQSRPLHLRTEPGLLKTRSPKPKESLIIGTQSSHKQSLKPPPDCLSHTFYHSDHSVGGKSAGYAWGYQGNFPRLAGLTGYLRDDMRKGLDIAVADGEAGTTRTRKPIKRDLNALV